jgi:hypothetical protein
MPKITLLALLILISANSRSQGPIGSWSDHLPYHSLKWVASGDKEVLGSTSLALSVYNKQYNEIRKLSKVHGLTDCGINTIGYSSATNSFVIAYTNSNIDILTGTTITNIPDIFNKYISGSKEINRVRTKDNLAYLATSFGIVILDIDAMEVYDTWNPSPDSESNSVYDIAFLGTEVYAATDAGLYHGSVNNQGLSYFGNWSIVSGSQPGKKYNALSAIDDRLFINSPENASTGDALLVWFNSALATIYQNAGVEIKSLEVSSEKLIVSAGDRIILFNKNGVIENTISSYGWGTPKANNAIIDNGVLYIADNEVGLVRSENMISFSTHIPPGPYLNSNHEIFYGEGNIYVSGGSVDNAWNNNFNPMTLHNYSERRWSTLIEYDWWDALRIRPVPGNGNNIYVSTWGSGLFEFRDGAIVNHYDDSNSPLQTIIPGEKYVRVCGMAFDRQNNLWITQSGVEGSIKTVMNDGTWITNPYTINAPTIGDIIISLSGYKWVILPRGHGLFVFDDNRTPNIFSDDRYKKFIPKDQDGNPLPNIYSMEEDMDGNIWIGTDQGPAVFYTPDRIFDGEISSYRIKVPRNDGSGLADLLLATETITTIAIDGGNRKWFGTNSSGAYLVSEDGLSLIDTYNKSNSPVLSDNITSIEVDGKTGEVWFGSDKGIVTLRETATDGGSEMDKIYAFPNPVREDFNGNVTITGLMANTNVKITDISGNLVFETISLGGQATWDLQNYKGDRVSTGVYLIFCSSEDGVVNKVTKMLILR